MTGAETMSGEKFYLDDDRFLITSRRLVVRRSSETIPLSRLADPRIEKDHSTRELVGWDLIKSFFVDPGTQTGDYRTTVSLVVSVDGTKKTIAEHRYYNVSFAAEDWALREKYPDEAERNMVVEEYNESSSMHQTSRLCKEEVKYLHTVAEIVGAALAGA